MAAARAAHAASRRSAGRRSDESGGSASGSSGGDAGPHDPLYPNGYSEDGVRAPDSNRRDTLIGGVDLHGAGGRGILGALHGAVGGPSAAVEEKDNTDWIFAPPEVCYVCACARAGRERHGDTLSIILLFLPGNGFVVFFISAEVNLR